MSTGPGVQTRQAAQNAAAAADGSTSGVPIVGHAAAPIEETRPVSGAPDAEPHPCEAENVTIPADLCDKINIPALSKYDGCHDPDVIRVWLSKISNYATFFNLSAAQTIALIPFFLEGAAAAWWTSLQLTHDVPDSWDRVMTVFQNEFLPSNYVNRL